MNAKQEEKTMRQFLAILSFGSALALFFVVSAAVPSFADETAGTKSEVATPAAGSEVAKPLIKCSTCGVEFTTLKEEAEHLKAHPEHKMAPLATQSSTKPLIKCSTCGVEFTSLKEAEEHLKAHPGHKLAAIPGQSAKPLIKCSTCGVEFTTLKEEQEHLEAHPEHKMAPME
jgi:DNA-directed RNA polymerase subunit RPC12/RpoP